MSSTATTCEDFKAIYQEGKAQTVYKWIVADLDTPVSAYLKLCQGKNYSFLLESVEGGAVLGRYTAIGMEPDIIWRYKDGKTETSADGKHWRETGDNNALAALQALLDDSKTADKHSDLPPMASSGLFGYLGYDMVRLIEDIPDKNPDTLGIPEAIVMRPSVMVIFDNVKHMVCLATTVRRHAGNSDQPAEVSYNEALKKLETVQNTLAAPITDPAPIRTDHETPLPVTSNMTKDEYEKAVRKAIEYIYAGDIFQVVPSQRFSVPFDLPPFELYRSLRRLNPSPFLFYLNFGGFSLVGSSPEILVRVRDGTVTIRPIAGTRKRGKTSEQDRALATELLADPKERAEHLMLLDLGRNDTGRVCATGSVSVTEQFTIEHYSHVMHIVSNVEGRLAQDKTSLDALFSGFPAGTVSGAPKIRAMEIIDELEPVRRSFYGGSVGYLDGNGDIDTCIALRTALVKDGHIYVQAGGGVVADSDPESEYEESCNKARAIIDAADHAVNLARKNKMRRTS